MLRLSLFLLLALVLRQSSAAPCNPCGASGYTMKANSNKSFGDGANGRLTCGTLRSWATQRQSHHDVCHTIVNYARQYCSCRNSSGQAPKALPVKSNTGTCTVGNVASNKMEYTPPAKVGGLGMKCKFWKKFANTAFTPQQCPQVKNIVSRHCSNRRRNLRAAGEDGDLMVEEGAFEEDYGIDENDPE